MTLGISPFPDRNAYCASELDKLFEFASFYLAISIIERRQFRQVSRDHSQTGRRVKSMSFLGPKYEYEVAKLRFYLTS